MAQVKTTSYIDAVNGMARAALLTDLQKALAPIIETMTSIHGVCLALKQKQDDLTERVKDLEDSVILHGDNIKRLQEEGAPPS